jgi:uncharacterized protein (TIGR00369 family)
VSVEAAEGLSGLEFMRRIASGDLPQPPIAATLDFGVISVEHGRAAFTGNPSEQHYNPIGVVHGGYAATLLDSALGCAVHTTLEPGEAYTTLTLEIKFVRPITRDTGTVNATAEVVHRGRRQATAEARLTDAETGKLLAHASSTCLVIAD